jgi:DNA polymerase-4
MQILDFMVCLLVPGNHANSRVFRNIFFASPLKSGTSALEKERVFCYDEDIKGVIKMSTLRTVFHIDVNSAYLSWEAVYRLQMGETLDLRTIPSAVGGDVTKRRGIILAKSIPAKAYNIQTGESVGAALMKCPNLVLVRPTYGLYIRCHRAMLELLKAYSPRVQVFSIDECFLEMTDLRYSEKSALEIAHDIRNRIREELGFTVNIGISVNKLLAKVASDFKKPDRVHTLYPEEIEEKMWPLPVGDLFMVGRATKEKLERMGIMTIGDLARFNRDLLKIRFKKHGDVIWHYANGLDSAGMLETASDGVKGIGNSTTIPFDVEDPKIARLYLLSLSEMVGMRLRDRELTYGLVSVSIRHSDFEHFSHQKKLIYRSDSTDDLYREICGLFDALWTGVPLRHLGVRVSDLSPKTETQLSFFDHPKVLARSTLDRTIDQLRLKYGNTVIQRCSFLHTGVQPVMGGVGDDDYPMMKSTL